MIIVRVEVEVEEQLEVGNSNNELNSIILFLIKYNIV